MKTTVKKVNVVKKTAKPLAKKPAGIKTDGRIWIETTEGKLVGKGRIELMEKIQQFGSIRQAAAAMKMSYRQAWQLVDDMNTKAKTPLVISQRGGAGGGKAIVTQKGEKIIALFNAFNKRFQQLLEKEAEKFIF
ncbi:MAG: LysR family transcriptional regulator [Ferruginibacter sp.]